MSDLISRQAAIDAFNEECDRLMERISTRKGLNYHDESERIELFECRLAEAEHWKDVIENLPVADRPKGEWTYLHGSIGSYMTISCPFCGETFNDVAEWKYNYCPNCGTKMN